MTDLRARQNGGGQVQALFPGGWRLEIPAGPSGAYRLAQLDDYMDLPRERFHWQAPLALQLRARVSAVDLPGTWGFGLWNDPFTLGLGAGGSARRLPALPNAAWFFHAGQPNYLAFRDHHSAQGFLAAVFSSPLVSSLALAPAGLALPLLLFPPAARLLRKMAARLIAEDSVSAAVDPLVWHTYRIEWRPNQARFFIDGQEIFTTSAAPRGRQGIVIWIDNQYVSFPPSGKLRMGTSTNREPAWLEVDEIVSD